MARVVVPECRDLTAARGRWTGALTAALLGATAMVLALTAAVLAEPVPAAAPAIATEALVRRYYAAVNAALATGDLAMLEAVIAADAHLTPESSELASVRATLAERITALRAAQPNLHIRVERVVAEHDEAVAWVSLEGKVAGGPVVLPSVASGTGLLDEFRVRDGQIAEVWGATPGLSAPASVIRADLDAVRWPVHIGLVRVEVDPGAEVPLLSGSGPAAITVESGRLQALMHGSGRLTRSLSQGGTASERTAPRVPASLAPGDQLVLTTGMPFRLRNEGNDDAVALLAVVFPLAATSTPPPAFDNAGLEVRSLLVEVVRAADGPPGQWWPSGVAVQRLVSQILTDEPSCPLRLDVQRMALAPDLEVAEWRPTAQMLLAVEHGAVLATTAQTARGKPAQPELVTGDGDAIAIAPGTRVSARGSGDDPAAVILLSLQESPTTSYPDSRVSCALADDTRRSGPR